MNSTAEKVGWTTEPGGRGTVGLLWSCFATIFLCTWSAVHPNLPALSDSPWKTFRRKIGYMLFCIVAPEWTATNALEDFRVVNMFKRKYKLRHPVSKRRWSLKHYYFLEMGGYVIQTDQMHRIRIDSLVLIELIRDGIIEAPELEDEDIDDRSKANWFTKFIALLQVTYFIAQLLARAIDQLPITTLELFTLGIVFCALVTYASFWQKPFDVNRPVVLRPPNAHEGGRHHDSLKDVGRTHLLQSPYANGYITWLLSLLVFVPFGAVHMIGWNFSFPSAAERWLWRAASVFCMAAPMPILALTDYLERHPGPKYADWVLGVGTTLYIVVRAYLCVEMLVGLRAVPAGVYRTVDWTEYFPAFG